MKCLACNRPLKRPAAMVGKLAIGPVCLRRMLGDVKKQASKKSSAVRMDQPELFDGVDECFFDQQGAVDRAALEARL